MSMVPKDGRPRGVRLERRTAGSKYEGRVYVDARYRYLGNYPTQAEAAFAVNVAYRLLSPGKPVPNPSSESTLSTDQRQAIQDRVAQLLDPGREPHQRKRPRRGYE
jgi:hypothetical protein